MELRRRFEQVQSRLPELWHLFAQDATQARTVVAVPSISLDLEGMALVDHLNFYEERSFYLLNLLKYPRCRLIFLSSRQVDESILAYHLHMLPGVPYSHARARLTILSTQEDSDRPLTEKVLARPALMARVERLIQDKSKAYIVCYNSSRFEMELAVRLGIPLMGPHPEHRHYGTKNHSRKLFRRLGIPLPSGCEELTTEEDIARALVELRKSTGESRFVVKQNLSLSGLGNAVFVFDEGREPGLEEVKESLPKVLRLQSPSLDWDKYRQRFARLGGVVESYVKGRSCSVQVRISPLGKVNIVATHDELMGGEDGQTYVGCRFPASTVALEQLHQYGLAIGEALRDEGLVGRLEADFIRDRDDKLWGLDINLRKGNTTLPIRTLQLMTGGRYLPDQGVFLTRNGEPRTYLSTDHLGRGGVYSGLLPQDAIDIGTMFNLHYSTSHHLGTVFHMLGGLSQLGRLGVTCIGRTHEEAERIYRETRQTLRDEAERFHWIV